ETSTATPTGPLSSAVPIAPPVPSAKPASPSPASVVTFPLGSIFRIRLLPVSATKTLPLASTATPRGPSNSAVPSGPPLPSTHPLQPPPAGRGPVAARSYPPGAPERRARPEDVPRGVGRDARDPAEPFGVEKSVPGAVDPVDVGVRPVRRIDVAARVHGH